MPETQLLSIGDRVELMDRLDEKACNGVVTLALRYQGHDYFLVRVHPPIVPTCQEIEEDKWYLEHFGLEVWPHGGVFQMYPLLPYTPPAIARVRKRA